MRFYDTRPPVDGSSSVRRSDSGAGPSLSITTTTPARGRPTSPARRKADAATPCPAHNASPPCLEFWTAPAARGADGRARASLGAVPLFDPRGRPWYNTTRAGWTATYEYSNPPGVIGLTAFWPIVRLTPAAAGGDGAAATDASCDDAADGSCDDSERYDEETIGVAAVDITLPQLNEASDGMCHIRMDLDGLSRDHSESRSRAASASCSSRARAARRRTCFSSTCSR